MNSDKEAPIKLGLLFVIIVCSSYAVSAGLKLMVMKRSGERSSAAVAAPGSVGQSSQPNAPLANQLNDRLNQLGAHPSDPTKPAGIPGQTDEALATIRLAEAAELLEHVEQHGVPAPLDEARILFQLGRIAQHQQMGERAAAYFEAAADLGHPGAIAYLGDMEPDPDTAMALYDEAYQRGFEPAQVWKQQLLADLQQKQAQAAAAQKLDYTLFSEPDMIQALYEEDMTYLNQNSRYTIVYLQGVQELMMDSGIAFRLQNGAQFSFEKDVNLDHQLSLKLLHDPNAMQEQMQVGMQQLTGFFGAIVEARKRGATVTEEVQSSMKALMPEGMVPIETIRARGREDAL
ncbi:MAG TPA: hypothetical protein DEA90_06655, partial [Opitutae bacterium]|nr:hypothetical protein [Opitutae bacterium]